MKNYVRKCEVKDYNLEEIREIVYTIIQDNIGLDIEDIRDDVNITELGFDSLDAVQLIMELEKTFDIAIMDEDMEKMETLNDVFYYLIPIKEWRKYKLKKIDSKSLRNK
jgi:acyl carrier protein